MGSWILRCALSGLPIDEGEPIVGCVTAMKQGTKMPANGIQNFEHLFIPASLLFSGTYFDYGHVQLPNQTAELIESLEAIGLSLDERHLLKIPYQDTSKDVEIPFDVCRKPLMTDYRYGLIICLKSVYESLNSFSPLDTRSIKRHFKYPLDVFYDRWFWGYHDDLETDKECQEALESLTKTGAIKVLEEWLDGDTPYVPVVKTPEQELADDLEFESLPSTKKWRLQEERRDLPISDSVHKQLNDLLNFYHLFTFYNLPFQPSPSAGQFCMSDHDFYRTLAQATLAYIDQDEQKRKDFDS